MTTGLARTVSGFVHLGLCVAILWITPSRSGADLVFDRADDAVELGNALIAALTDANTVSYMASYSEDDTVRLWSDGEPFVGHEAVSMRIGSLIGAHQPGEFQATAPRVLVDPGNTWVLFDWTWGADSGTQIARLRSDGNGWNAVDVDFDGSTVGKQKVQFDSTRTVERVAGATDALRLASAAFAGGDFAAVPLAEPFRFHDSDGAIFEGVEALVAAAFARVPDGITEERMTLLVSHETRRAVAYQDAGGSRVSLSLIRFDVWQIAAASLSTRLEVLPVSPRSHRLMQWAALRPGP